MAKLSFLLILFFISSCSSTRKDEDYGLSVKMRDKLFNEQSILEELTETKDQLFLRYTPNKCIKDWTKNVESLKQKLKRTVDNKVRQMLWFNLGNCYILIGENKLAMYYYDLVLGLGLNNKRVDSSIYFNMGQIYENANKDFLAYSYYQLAKEKGDKGRLSLFKLAVLEFKQAEYSLSNKYLSDLRRYYPKSDVINFLIGINYFHLGRKRSYLNKVLVQLDEKSVSKVLLLMAMDFSEGKNLKSLEADLGELDLKLSIHKQFRNYLLGQLER